MAAAGEQSPAASHNAHWWAMHDDEPTRTSDARYDLDAAIEAFSRDVASGLLKRFSRHGVRMFLGAIGGSGVADVVRYDNGVEVDVNNFVLPLLRRRVYLADEPLILLRASLSSSLLKVLRAKASITAVPKRV
jgi:hypothetical protein